MKLTLKAVLLVFLAVIVLAPISFSETTFNKEPDEIEGSKMQTFPKDNLLNLNQLETVGNKTKPIPFEYSLFFNYATAGPVIPALNQNYIPQGLTYLPEKNWLIGTIYANQKNTPTVLFVIDNSSGKLIKAFNLYLDSETIYAGHAGGVTVSERHLWIASDGKVYQFDLDAVIDQTQNTKLIAKSVYDVETRASFISYYEGYLWVGEFTLEKSHSDYLKYPHKESHHIKSSSGKEYLAWTVGYRLENDNFPADGYPEGILAHINKIQGLTFSEDSIYLSQSYGRANNSYLYDFHNILNDKEDMSVDLNGKKVPLWFLELNKRPKKITLPPLAEGIVLAEDKLYIMFESGADKYRTTTNKYPLDRIQILSTAIMAK